MATGNSLHARTSYLPSEIAWGQLFAEMNSRVESGSIVTDWNLFDETIPCSTFHDMTQFNVTKLGVQRYILLANYPLLSIVVVCTLSHKYSSYPDQTTMKAIWVITFF